MAEFLWQLKKNNELLLYLIYICLFHYFHMFTYSSHIILPAYFN